MLTGHCAPRTLLKKINPDDGRPKALDKDDVVWHSFAEEYCRGIEDYWYCCQFRLQHPELVTWPVARFRSSPWNQDASVCDVSSPAPPVSSAAVWSTGFLPLVTAS